MSEERIAELQYEAGMYQSLYEHASKQRKQTRKASLAESLMNVAFGYGIALASQIVVFPWFGINIPLSSNIAIGLIFTAVALARQFALRRLFEALRVRRVLP
jgi:hypothetical protein